MAWKTRAPEIAAERGWSYAELARRLGMHPTLLTRIIAGKRPPSIRTERAFERLFPDVPIRQMIWWEEEEATG